jgi:hypothetical protein
VFVENVKRYIPLLVWIVVAATLIFIPLKIISYGFLPMDDALRHAAKTISGKSWQQILVMRGDFPIDPSPGWQQILQWVHELEGGGDAESLVIFSVVALMLLVTLSGLPWFRRPEAWMGALFAAAVLVPACTTRFARGRPYLVTDAVLITILFLWSGSEKDRPRRTALIFTPLLVAASAWIHGSWYLLCLPGAAILFAGFWRAAMCYGLCWAGGSVLGCAFTGHPFEFLFQSVRHMFGVFDFVVNRQLEPELHPSDGAIAAVLAVCVLLVWRAVALGWNPKALLNPAFMMMGLGWVLGLKMQRFWWDFGTPAFIVWTAREMQAHFEQQVVFDSARRLFITVAIAAGVFLAFTSDRDGRWTENLTTEYFSPDNPDAAGWLPGDGGIVYNSDMDVFFQTFFKNPTADWRYILGFESGWMRPEDLAVYRKIQWNFGDPRAFEPWVKEMRPPDRMIIRGGDQPRIPELEWHYVGSGLWVGRLPPSKFSANGKSG